MRVFSLQCSQDFKVKPNGSLSFSIILETTPDISHTNQMSQVLRYVKISESKDDVEVVESFIDFLPVRYRKTAEALTKIILPKLKQGGLDVIDYRG